MKKADEIRYLEARGVLEHMAKCLGYEIKELKLSPCPDVDPDVERVYKMMRDDINRYIKRGLRPGVSIAVRISETAMRQIHALYALFCFMDNARYSNSAIASLAIAELYTKHKKNIELLVQAGINARDGE